MGEHSFAGRGDVKLSTRIDGAFTRLGIESDVYANRLFVGSVHAEIGEVLSSLDSSALGAGGACAGLHIFSSHKGFASSSSIDFEDLLVFKHKFRAGKPRRISGFIRNMVRFAGIEWRLRVGSEFFFVAPQSENRFDPAGRGAVMMNFTPSDAGVLEVAIQVHPSAFPASPPPLTPGLLVGSLWDVRSSWVVE